MVQGRAQAVDVAAGIRVAGSDVVLLRRGVLRTAHPAHRRPRARVLGVPQLDQSEVHEHRAAVAVDDHVVWLHVAMDDAPSVTVGKGAQQVLGQAQYLGFAQRTVRFDAACQAFPFDQLHDQVNTPALNEEVGHVHQIGVLEASQCARLLLKLLAQLCQREGVEIWLSRHLLDGNGYPQA